MPGLTGPLFSLSASGTIGKALTYSRWRGIQYARTRVIPKNPNSSSQQDVRNAFRSLNTIYTMLGLFSLSSWDWATRGKPLTPRNELIHLNGFNATQNMDTEDLILIGPSGSIPTLSNVVDSDGGGQKLHFVFTDPGTPPGYEFPSILAVAIEHDTYPITHPPVVAEFQSGSSASPVDLQLPAAGTYDWSIALWAVPIAFPHRRNFGHAIVGQTVIA